MNITTIHILNPNFDQSLGDAPDKVSVYLTGVTKTKTHTNRERQSFARSHSLKHTHTHGHTHTRPPLGGLQGGKAGSSREKAYLITCTNIGT